MKTRRLQFGQWPEGANDNDSTPLNGCPVCGALQASAGHSHSKK